LLHETRVYPWFVECDERFDIRYLLASVMTLRENGLFFGVLIKKIDDRAEETMSKPLGAGFGKIDDVGGVIRMISRAMSHCGESRYCMS